MKTEAPTRFDPASYRDWRRTVLGRTTDVLEQELILNVIGDVAGLKILDAGCGDGELAVEIWKRGATVTGIDASPQMIEAARERARRHGAAVAFDVAILQSLPFPPDSFDRVVAITVLCFVEDSASAFREMTRVLRPGGWLVVGELGKTSIWAEVRRLRGWLGNPVWRHARFRTAGDLRRLAHEAGLVVQVLRGAIYYPPCGGAVRLLGPLDRHVGRLTTFGAAFLVLAAAKPAQRSEKDGEQSR